MQAPAAAAGCKSDLRILDPESGELKRDHLPQAEVFTTPSCSLLMEFVSITQDMSVMMVQKMEVRISMIIAWP